MKKPVQIFPTQMNVYSHVGYSRERAAYYIGRPDGPKSMLFAISAREAEELIVNLPEELLEKVKEHYLLIPKDKIEEPFYPVDTDEFIPPAPTEDESEMILDNMGITQLRKIASELEIKSYTKYDKKDLIKKIEEVAEASEA